MVVIFMEKKSKMAAKYTRKPHNVLPKFNFQFSMTSSLLLSTHLVSTHPYHYWHLFITSYFKLLDKSSTVAEMGDRDHNRHEPKRGGCCAPFAGGAGSPSNTVAWAEVYFRTKWRLHPSSRLATIDMGRKLGGCAFLELRPHLTQRRLGRSLPQYQVASWSIQPMGHNKHGPQIGGLCPFGGEGAGSPSKTQCASAKAYLHAKFHIDLLTQYTNVTDRQADRTGRQTTVW